MQSSCGVLYFTCRSESSWVGKGLYVSWLSQAVMMSLGSSEKCVFGLLFPFLYRLYSPKEDWAWLGCLYWLWLATFFLPHIGNANMFLFSQWSPRIPSLTSGTLAPTVFIHHLASLCNDGSYSSFLSHLKKKTVNTSHKKKILISPYSTHHHHYWILHMKSFLSFLPFFFLSQPWHNI